MKRYLRSVYMRTRNKGRITSFNSNASQGVSFSDESDYIVEKQAEAEQTVQFADSSEQEFVPTNQLRTVQVGRIMIHAGDTQDYGVERIYVNEIL